MSGPQRRVTIERAFWLGAHEVTQAQYEAVMGEKPELVRAAGRRSRSARGPRSQVVAGGHD